VRRSSCQISSEVWKYIFSPYSCDFANGTVSIATIYESSLDQSTMYTASLPIELWTSIIATSSRSTQIQCLSVCRGWHTISIHLLFSTVRIHFGLPQDPTSSEDEEVQLISQSWDILDHIANDVSFARSVKNMVVFAFAKGHTIFQRRVYRYSSTL
jgi:hypothetical protein